MPTPNRFSDGKATFLIQLITNFEVWVCPKLGRTLKLELSQDLPVIRTTKEKQAFQKAAAADKTAAAFVASLETPGRHCYSGPVPFRWASGGYLPIFVIDNVPYCMLFLRDLEPVVGWNVANGASASLRELWHVELMVEREPKEEILIINRAGGQEFCYRLELPGGSIQAVDHHKKVLKLLEKNIPIRKQPLVGRTLPGAPDRIEVNASWALKESPHITTDGYVVFNHEKGENGIEFIKVVEWEIDEKLVNLVFFDAELHETSDDNGDKVQGTPILQAVGLFQLNELLEEFHKVEPAPRPKVVYDRGHMVSGELLDEWLASRPHARQWCPVARRTLRRHIDHTYGGRNRMVRTSKDVWTISFEGKATHYKDRYGLVYIAHLLQRPGEPVSCETLSNLTHPSSPDALSADAAAMHGLHGEGLSVDGMPSAQPRLDAQAVRQIKERLAKVRKDLGDINSELDAAKRDHDAGAVERLTVAREALLSEANALATQLNKDLGRANKSRNCGGDCSDRKRNAVSKDIQRALDEIDRLDPTLGEHLKKSIYKGRDCIYVPSKPACWRFC